MVHIASEIEEAQDLASALPEPRSNPGGRSARSPGMLGLAKLCFMSTTFECHIPQTPESLEGPTPFQVHASLPCSTQMRRDLL